MPGNWHVRFGGGPYGKGPANCGHLAVRPTQQTLWLGGSGTLVRYVLVAALNRARQLRRRLAAVPALLSCSGREQTVGVDHRPVGR